jgi:integrase
MTTTKSSRHDNCIIPIHGKKGTAYKVLVRRKGYGTISKTFNTRREARAFRDKVLGDANIMIRLAGAGARTTLAEIADHYGNNYSGKDDHVTQRLGYWQDLFGSWTLVAITRPVIAEQYHKLYQNPEHKRTRATANRYLSTLSQVFEIAVDMGLIDVNPCKGIKRGGETHRFGRALTDDERETLLNAAKQSEWDRLYLLISMALSTGARLSELMSLTWNDLDVRRAVAKLADTKNGTPRYLPIIPSVLEQIQDLPRPIDSGVYLFHSNHSLHVNAYHSFRPYWIRALEVAGITDLRFHDLRHSAASYLTEAGVPLVTVAEILGHKTMAMVQRYSHVHTAQKAKVVEEVFKDLLG